MRSNSWSPKRCAQHNTVALANSVRRNGTTMPSIFRCTRTLPLRSEDTRILSCIVSWNGSLRSSNNSKHHTRHNNPNPANAMAVQLMTCPRSSTSSCSNRSAASPIRKNWMPSGHKTRALCSSFLDISPPDQNLWSNVGLCVVSGRRASQFSCRDWESRSPPL